VVGILPDAVAGVVEPPVTDEADWYGHKLPSRYDPKAIAISAVRVQESMLEAA